MRNRAEERKEVKEDTRLSVEANDNSRATVAEIILLLRGTFSQFDRTLLDE